MSWKSWIDQRQTICFCTQNLIDFLVALPIIIESMGRTRDRLVLGWMTANSSDYVCWKWLTDQMWVIFFDLKIEQFFMCALPIIIESMVLSWRTRLSVLKMIDQGGPPIGSWIFPFSWTFKCFCVHILSFVFFLLVSAFFFCHEWNLFWWRPHGCEELKKKKNRDKKKSLLGFSGTPWSWSSH